MAERLALSGRLEEAEHWALRAEQIHPMPGVMHFRIGRAFLTQGNVDAALAHLAKAARMDPDQSEISYALGQALVDAGRPSEAVPHLRRAFNAGVRRDLAGYDLVRALAATGDREGALSTLKDVEPARLDDANSWYRLGELAQQLEEPTLAATFYERAARAAPQSAAFREQLGLMLALSGDVHRAVSELEAAVRLDPSDPTAHLNLAATYFQLGRRQEARAQAEEALRLDPNYGKAAELLKALVNCWPLSR